MRGIFGHAGLVVAAGVLSMGLVACGDGEDRPATGGSASGSGSGTGVGSGSHAGEHGGEATSFPESDANTVVRSTLRDFAFEGVGPTVKGPKVYFEATNEGPSEHELVVVDDSGKELGEIEVFNKGEKSKPLALELQPGRYKTTCLVKLGDKTHADLGMEASFTVE